MEKIKSTLLQSYLILFSIQGGLGKIGRAASKDKGTNVKFGVTTFFLKHRRAGIPWCRF